MKRFEALACGAALAVSLGGCAVSEPDDRDLSWRAGEATVIQLAEPATFYYTPVFEGEKGSKVLGKAGEDCLTVRGAAIDMVDEKFIYRNPNSRNAQCPDGAKIDVTFGWVKEQSRMYDAFVRRRAEIIPQVAAMDEPTGDTVELDFTDMDSRTTEVLNESPITLPPNSSKSNLEYGNLCWIGKSKAAPIGRLRSSETVFKIMADPDWCPVGTKFIL